MMKKDPFFHPVCGLHGVNVVVSEHNKNGECSCLNCNPCIVLCQTCNHYKDLLKEAKDKKQLMLERCITCMNQK